MIFKWSDKSIRWFLDASAYTDFHKRLAVRILPFLLPNDTVCDVGCGLGRLSMEFAKYVKEITAIDSDSKVLAELQRDVELLRLENMRITRGDAFAIKGNFDVLIMSFFGKSEKNEMEFYYNLCNRILVRIVNVEIRDTLFPGRRFAFKDTVSVVQKELDDKGRDYELITDSFEFGQPFRSMADAEDFVTHNAPEITKEEADKFLSEKLTKTDNDEFPLYIANPKEIGIFIIKKA